MSLFATKSVSRILSEAEGGAHQLKRTLGPVQLVALGIGAIIGAGLFSLTGIAAAQNSGPAVTLSMIVAAIGCAFAGLCYSEFSCMIPVSGSAYTYAYATMGEWIAWIIGWDLVIEYGIGSATVSISWSAYVVSLLHTFGIDLPARWIAGPFEAVELPNGTMAQGYANLPAVVVVFLVSVLLMTGIKESARTNAVVVVIKLAVVLAFIGAGWSFINPANYKPFLPANTGEFGAFGLSGLMMGAGTIFFAYIGFDAVSTAAQECKNPQRDMPIGIIGSLAVCTVLYLLFGHVLTGLVNYTQLGVAAPVALAIDKTPYVWMNNLVVFGIYLRLHVGDSGDAAGAIPRILFDVAGWPDSQNLFRYSPAISDALAFEHAFLLSGGAVLGATAAPHSRPHDQHWDSVCIRDRVRRGLDHAREESESGAPLQNAMVAGGSHSGNRGELCAHVLAGLVELAAFDCVDVDWPGDLLWLRPAA